MDATENMQLGQYPYRVPDLMEAALYSHKDKPICPITGIC